MYVDQRIGSPFGGFDPFFSSFSHDPVRAAAVRKRRSREIEAARRREAWEIEQRRRAELQHRRKRLARKVWGRTYARAATTIQRAWRAHRGNAAAATITRAVRRAGAVTRGRRILGALRDLARIEAEVAAVPANFEDSLAQLVFEDSLEKLTLRLDRIDSHGSPFVRERRREVVRAAQHRLTCLDDHRESAGSDSDAEEVDPEVAGWADTSDRPDDDGPDAGAGAGASDDDSMDATDAEDWTEVTDADFEAAVCRRDRLLARVADARTKLGMLEAELAAAEEDLRMME